MPNSRFGQKVRFLRSTQIQNDATQGPKGEGPRATLMHDASPVLRATLMHDASPNGNTPALCRRATPMHGYVTCLNDLLCFGVSDGLARSPCAYVSQSALPRPRIMHNSMRLLCICSRRSRCARCSARPARSLRACSTYTRPTCAMEVRNTPTHPPTHTHAPSSMCVVNVCVKTMQCMLGSV